MRRTLITQIAAGSAIAAAAVTLVACGAGGGADGAATAAAARAAAQAALVCPNKASNAAALMLDNRVGGDLLFRASGVSCDDWSQTGNPTRYSGRAFGDWNKVVRWGLQPASGATPTFVASFTTSPGGAAVTSLQVKLGQVKMTGGNWQPHSIETRLTYGDPWKKGSHVVGSLNGRQVRVTTGIVTNPGDGTWDSPNGAGAAQRAWFMRFQYAN